MNKSKHQSSDWRPKSTKSVKIRPKGLFSYEIWKNGEHLADAYFERFRRSGRIATQAWVKPIAGNVETLHYAYFADFVKAMHARFSGQ